MKKQTNQGTTFIVEASVDFSFSYAAVAQPSHSNMPSSSFLRRIQSGKTVRAINLNYTNTSSSVARNQTFKANKEGFLFTSENLVISSQQNLRICLSSNLSTAIMTRPYMSTEYSIKRHETLHTEDQRELCVLTCALQGHQ